MVDEPVMERGSEEIKDAKRPHELFVLNLIFFHLLAVPAALALDFGYWGLLLPPVTSALLLLYFRKRIGQLSDDQAWIRGHWVLGVRRFRWLYLGYLIVSLLLALVWLFVDPGSIEFVALTRVAIMPAVILVLVTFVLSTAAIGRAGSGER